MKALLKLEVMSRTENWAVNAELAQKHPESANSFANRVFGYSKHSATQRTKLYAGGCQEIVRCELRRLNIELFKGHLPGCIAIMIIRR